MRDIDLEIEQLNLILLLTLDIFLEALAQHDDLILGINKDSRLRWSILTSFELLH